MGVAVGFGVGVGVGAGVGVGVGVVSDGSVSWMVLPSVSLPVVSFSEDSVVSEILDSSSSRDDFFFVSVTFDFLVSEVSSLLQPKRLATEEIISVNTTEMSSALRYFFILTPLYMYLSSPAFPSTEEIVPTD